MREKPQANLRPPVHVLHVHHQKVSWFRRNRSMLPSILRQSVKVNSALPSKASSEFETTITLFATSPSKRLIFLKKSRYVAFHTKVNLKVDSAVARNASSDFEPSITSSACPLSKSLMFGVLRFKSALACRAFPHHICRMFTIEKLDFLRK